MDIRSLLEGMMIRARLANLAGKTFGGKRDLFKALGYQRELQPQDYRSRFRRNGVAFRVVAAPPVACWRGGADVIEDDDPNFITDFEQAVIDLDRRVQLWKSLQKVDVLGRIGRYGVLFLGLPGRAQPARDEGRESDGPALHPRAARRGRAGAALRG
jgi:hypothetical protein